MVPDDHTIFLFKDIERLLRFNLIPRSDDPREATLLATNVGSVDSSLLRHHSVRYPSLQPNAPAPLGQKQGGIVAPVRVQLQQTVHNHCIFHSALPHLG
jgi:hypothetical protein